MANSKMLRKLAIRHAQRKRNVASADSREMAAAKPYQKNVFINCPFDRNYRPLFDALVFAVHDAGYIARSAQEVRDTARFGLRRFFGWFGNPNSGFTTSRGRQSIARHASRAAICLWNSGYFLAPVNSVIDASEKGHARPRAREVLVPEILLGYQRAGP
jgi:hypothetical protein